MVRGKKANQPHHSVSKVKLKLQIQFKYEYAHML